MYLSKIWTGPTPNGPLFVSCYHLLDTQGFFFGGASGTSGSDRWRFLVSVDLNELQIWSSITPMVILQWRRKTSKLKAHQLSVAQTFSRSPRPMPLRNLGRSVSLEMQKGNPLPETYSEFTPWKLMLGRWKVLLGRLIFRCELLGSRRVL